MFVTEMPKELLNPEYPEAKWNVTGLFAHRAFLEPFSFTMSKLKMTGSVDAIHGCADVLWNGGRPNMGRSPLFSDVVQYFRKFNEKGIGVYLTFTNRFFGPDGLNDRDSNLLLDSLDEHCGLNGVIVAGDLLAKYIRKKKPGLKQIASVVWNFLDNPAGDIDWYRTMEDRFDRVVVHTDHMFRLDLMERLDRQKAEIMVNEPCLYKCPNRIRHQSLIGEHNLKPSPEIKAQLDRLRKEKCGASLVSYFEGKGHLNPAKRRNCILTRAEVKQYYDMGFRHFKIAGRSETLFYGAWNLIHYIVNPALEGAFASLSYKIIEEGLRSQFTGLLNENKKLRSQVTKGRNY